MSEVKMKALRSFSDTIHGDVVEGQFYKTSRGRADHWVKNGLGEEITVQNKMQRVNVTNTKPARAPRTATKQAGGKDGNTTGRKSDAGKGATSRKR